MRQAHAEDAVSQIAGSCGLALDSLHLSCSLAIRTGVLPSGTHIELPHALLGKHAFLQHQTLEVEWRLAELNWFQTLR